MIKECWLVKVGNFGEISLICVEECTELKLAEIGLVTDDLNKLSLFKNVSSLDLSRNQLEKFPTILTQLQSLKSLNLNYNKLVSLSCQLGNMPNLKTLTFDHNPVTEYFVTIIKYNEIDKLKIYLRNNLREYSWKHIQIIFK